MSPSGSLSEEYDEDGSSHDSVRKDVEGRREKEEIPIVTP